MDRLVAKHMTVEENEKILTRDIKMDFVLGGIPIHNARNIEWKSNDDGTGQLWFNTMFVDKDGKEQDVRFHIFRLKFDDPMISMESVDNKLYEIEIIDHSF